MKSDLETMFKKGDRVECNSNVGWLKATVLRDTPEGQKHPIVYVKHDPGQTTNVWYYHPKGHAWLARNVRRLCSHPPGSVIDTTTHLYCKICGKILGKSVLP